MAACQNIFWQATILLSKQRSTRKINFNFLISVLEKLEKSSQKSSQIIIGDENNRRRSLIWMQKSEIFMNYFCVNKKFKFKVFFKKS